MVGWSATKSIKGRHGYGNVDSAQVLSDQRGDGREKDHAT